MAAPATMREYTASGDCLIRAYRLQRKRTAKVRRRERRRTAILTRREMEEEVKRRRVKRRIHLLKRITSEIEKAYRTE